MFTLMTEPQHCPEINDFQQLAHSKLTVFASQKETKDLFKNPIVYDLSKKKLNHRLKASQLPIRGAINEELFQLCRNSSRFALILAKNSFDLWEVQDPSWRKYRPMDDALHHTMKFILIRRNWIFADPVNTLLGRMNAAGLPLRWREDFRDKTRLYFRVIVPRFAPSGDDAEVATLPPATSADPVTPLTLEHLSPPLQLLAAGLLLAAAVWAAERRCGKKRTQPPHLHPLDVAAPRPRAGRKRLAPAAIPTQRANVLAAD